MAENRRDEAEQLIRELVVGNPEDGFEIPEELTDHIIIEGYLTEDLDAYKDAARNGNVEAMNELLDTDLENR